ncbi:MAG: hypothetical protein K0Q79_3740 [Flavipsychrobacter sp.]|jgi:hypothetical protein|nr:hypothetical protein [Flavipsychrobacter sp.]
MNTIYNSDLGRCLIYRTILNKALGDLYRQV